MKIFSVCLLGMCLGAGIVDFSNWYNPDEPPYLPSPNTAVLVLPGSKYPTILCETIGNMNEQYSTNCDLLGDNWMINNTNDYELTEN